jgi:hypothetical protein
MQQIRPCWLLPHETAQQPFRFRKSARVERFEVPHKEGSSSFLKKRTKKLLSLKVST